MTPEQVKGVIGLYDDLVRKWVDQHAQDFPLVPRGPLGPVSDLWRYPDDREAPPDHYDTCLHLLWMLGEMRKQLSDPSKIQKTMRWLGFVQGTLWTKGLATIKEMKGHNT